MLILAQGRHIKVWADGELTVEIGMDKWTEVKKNPDGSGIPAWLYPPAAALPAKSRIGPPGKGGDATVWFRNVRLSPTPHGYGLNAGIVSRRGSSTSFQSPKRWKRSR